MLTRLPAYLRETPERVGDLFIDPDEVKAVTPSGVAGCSVLHSTIRTGPQVLIGEPYDVMCILFPDDTPEGRRLRVEHSQAWERQAAGNAAGVDQSGHLLPPEEP